MVHNGIEYGDMQLICEAYHLMKSVLQLRNDEMSEVNEYTSQFDTRWTPGDTSEDPFD